MKCKQILAALCSAALVLSLVGCGDKTPAASSAPAASTGTDTAQTAPITIWAWDDNFNVKAANIAKDLYQKEHPDVEINVVSMALSDIRQKMNTAFAADNYDGMPNIVLVEDYSIGGYLSAFPGTMRDLSDVVNKADWMDYKLNVLCEGDKVYGVPFDSGVTGMFYRTDLLEQAGYTAADLTDITWDEYIEIGKAVKEKTGVSMLQITSGDLTLIKIMMQSAGEWYVKEDGVTPNIVGNNTLKEAIITYKKLIESNIVMNVPGWDAMVQAVQNGELATIVDGCWIASTIETAADQSGKWAVAPVPRLSNVKTSVNASNVGGASWYVIDKVPGGEVAADFLKATIAGNTDYLNTLVKEICLVNTLKDPSKITNYQVESPFFSNQKIYESFNAWAVKVPAVNYGINTYATDDIVEESIQSIMQGADIDETIQTIADRVASIG